MAGEFNLKEKKCNLIKTVFHFGLKVDKVRHISDCLKHNELMALPADCILKTFWTHLVYTMNVLLLL